MHIQFQILSMTNKSTRRLHVSQFTRHKALSALDMIFFGLFISSLSSPLFTTATFSRSYLRKMAEPRGRQRSIINLIFEISRVFRALWGPFVSGSDINLSDNVLGNAVSEAESHIAFADTRFNGKNAEKNAEIIGPHSHIKMARLHFVHILYFARAV